MASERAAASPGGGMIDHPDDEHFGPPPERRAPRDRSRVLRFSVTERVLHAAHGVAFFLLLGSGLVLFLPFLAQVAGNRPVVKAFHLAVAALWITALVLIWLLGDRRALRRTRHEFEALTGEDLRWMRSRAARECPQGKFNGGQSFHAVLQAVLAILFTVSGTLMYLGERVNELRLPGSIAVHDLSMVVGTIFVIGHILIATSPRASPSLSGMLDGTVPTSYAAEHHPRWDPSQDPVRRTPSPTRVSVAVAMVVLVVGVAGAALLAGA